MLRNGFHAQLGERVRRSERVRDEALQVASSLFYDGIAHFDGGDDDAALARFEQSLAINQSCTKQPTTAPYALCCNNIAAVHARRGKPLQATVWYERALEALTAKEVCVCE